MTKVLWFAVPGIAAVALPLLLHRSNVPVISNTYGKDYQIFELFGFCGSIFIICTIIAESKRVPTNSIASWIPILLPALVAFQTLLLISEYSTKSWDYLCYERAAQALQLGKELYGDCYIYPPLTAQVLSSVYRGITWSSAHIWNTPLSSESTWDTVFYLYQCAQFFLLIIAHRLSAR